MLTKCIFYYNDIYEHIGYAVLFCNGIDNSFCNLHERTLLVYMTNIYIASIYLRDKSVRVLCNALSVHMTHLFCDTARVGTDMKFGYAGTISSRASQTQTPPIPAGSAHLVPGYEVERCMGA